MLICSILSFSQKSPKVDLDKFYFKGQNLEEDIKNNRQRRFLDIKELEEKKIEGKILDKLKLKRYCCRRMLLSHQDLCDKI